MRRRNSWTAGLNQLGPTANEIKNEEVGEYCKARRNGAKHTISGRVNISKGKRRHVPITLAHVGEFGEK